ncbi:MAG: Ribosome small subunit-stimulated GTPase EngC [Brockia lithotrophica]|uniref:Small ribosomal subunit biogenesis GTPase RsgA n=1 Tax=Brockia lithotrophica TaxID=933949 RepID=A0A2T5G6E1_9BACL|nr:MAG: Ribosome small subunit-stimulated GTPase EngC [Brockia lithotrophica]
MCRSIEKGGKVLKETLLRGRIVRALAGYYDVAVEEEERETPPAGNARVPRRSFLRTRARGRLRELGVTPLVGDLALVQPTGDGEGVLHEVLPRKSELVRPPVANVDAVLVVATLRHPEVDLAYLDRLLVHVEHARLEAILFWNKVDLLDPSEREELAALAGVYRRAGYATFAGSVRTGEALPELRAHLAGKVLVLAGPSGVGKTSFLRALRPDLSFAVGDLSRKLGRGRHTTREVVLVDVGQGSWVADAPGFGALRLPDVEFPELGRLFPEIAGHAEGCRFRDCLHEREPGCAVRAAVERGEIARSRYTNYLAFLRELREMHAERY